MRFVQRKLTNSVLTRRSPLPVHRSVSLAVVYLCTLMKGFAVHIVTGCMVLASVVLRGQEAELMPLEKLPFPVNTPEYDEGGAILSPDGKSLFFTRSGFPGFDRTLIHEGEDAATTQPEYDYRSLLSSIYSEISNQEITDPYGSSFNQDILFAGLHGDTIGEVIHPGYPVNNALPNSVVSARLDSQRLVVINQFYRDGSMYAGFSLLPHSNGVFGFPEPLHIYDYYNISSDVSMALSARGQVMILSLERKDTYGQKDLYVSFRIEDDLWSTPQNIGMSLNSAWTETTPHIAADNRRLYFASDRPGGMGGLDIYVTERLDYTWLKWSTPKLLNAPINSAFDDSQPFDDERNSNFYFTSRRDGSADIFRQPLKPKPRLKAPIIIKGLVLDELTYRPIRAEVLFGPTDVKSYLEYYHTFTGEFSAVFTEYGVYKFLAHKPGYKDARMMFDTRLADKADLPVHEVIIFMRRDTTGPVADPIPVVLHELQPVSIRTPEVAESTTRSPSATLEETPLFAAPPKAGDKITFYNIYFRQSEAVILSASQKALDDLYRLLYTYPDVQIRIEGHTDNVGNERDLMELSWQRAQAIKVNLVRNGINPVRISTIGFGSMRPVADNRNEDGRVKNRRVEIQVVE